MGKKKKDPQGEPGGGPEGCSKRSEVLYQRSSRICLEDEVSNAHLGDLDDSLFGIRLSPFQSSNGAYFALVYLSLC
jgi:hypothetical protein